VKVAEINMIPYGSTGKIMLQIADEARKSGIEVKTYSTVPFDKRKKNFEVDAEEHYCFGSFSENKRHYYLGSTFGKNGCYSRKGTKELINYLKGFGPDIVHLHNLHKFCVNLPMLFGYLKESKVKVIWTLHDCWAFTGQCPHFTMVKCDKWKTGCHHCPQLNSYPTSRIDNSKRMYEKKKEWFCSIEDMTIVTPSHWLEGLVKQSFLSEYETKVIHNGIDLSVFKPTESDFRKKYNCEDKFIVLGVSFGWGIKKGLDVFIELANRLDERFQTVLVGTNDVLDAQLPKNIISIHRTHNQNELAEIYSAADLFVNPTREEVLGLVNIESLACGTPVLTFRTGGSPECIDETCGSVVDVDDIDSMEREILRISEENPYSKEACVKRAEKFKMNERFSEYVALYKEVGKR